jgi:hypothetical protein
MRPDERRVQRIMADTGMAYLQAYRHEQQRMELAHRARAHNWRMASDPVYMGRVEARRSRVRNADVRAFPSNGWSGDLV